MEPNDQEIETLPTAEDDAAADAAFAAGFQETRGEESGAVKKPDGQVADITPPADTEAAAQEPAKEDQVATAAAEEAARQAAAAEAIANAQAAADAPVALKKSELDSLLATAALIPQLQEELRRTRDTTAGKIGSIQQTLEAVRAQAQNGQKPSLTQLKRLEGEFPELAKLLKDDLEAAFSAPAAAAPAANPAAQAVVDQPVQAPAQAETTQPADPFADPRVQQTLREKEMAIVDAAHPDWRSLAGTPEFNEWRGTLSAQSQQVLANSWESPVLIGAFKDFKGWLHQRAVAAAASKQRDKRLERAVPATTGQPSGANAVDEDAAFLQGFKQARG